MTTAPDWADQGRRLLDALRGLVDDPAADAGDDAHAGECRWCPHCQLLAVLRGDRPELTAALGDIVATTVTALRQFAGDPAAGGPADPPAGGPVDPPTGAPVDPPTGAPADPPTGAPADPPAAEDAGPGDPAPVVQRIEIA